MTTLANTRIITGTRPTQRAIHTQKLSGWHICRFNIPLARQNLMFCRFTTCLDSRKTGHRVQQEVLKKKDNQYSWGLPECFRSAEERDQRNQSTRIKRGEGLRPFILDILRGFGHELKERFLREYENLSGQPGAPRFEADRDLLSPYQKVMGKLSEIDSLPGVYLNELVREARKELRTLEGHVENTKTEWARVFRTGSTSARNRMLVNLRQKFESGPDVPHLSHLGDISEIRASCAYRRYGADNPKFAFGMAFDVLCKIKARESGGTTLSRDLVELVTVPKIAVRTLSALRSGV
jgi:RNA-dependent RNA polymerase